MQSSLILAILVVMGQVGATDNRSETPRYPAETGNKAAEQPWDYSPVTPPAKTNTAPAELPAASAPAVNTAEVKPFDLWKSISNEPATGRLPGSPLSLADAVSGAATRSEQTARVAAYWGLAAAVTDYYLALRESTELETLRQSISRPSFAWDEARMQQSSRIKLAQAAAEAAQNRLEQMRKSTDGELPLASDSPHSGAYEPRYEENFSGRDSAQALQLAELLPQLHQELRNETASVTADQQWLQSVSQQRDPQSDGTALLKAYELLSLHRREFVRTVANYNVQIARYSELATPGQVGTGRLVAMLIETTPGQSATGDGSGITRTSAEEPVEPQAPRRTTPQTFEAQSRPLTRSAPATKPGGERSILVQPQ